MTLRCGGKSASLQCTLGSTLLRFRAGPLDLDHRMRQAVRQHWHLQKLELAKRFSLELCVSSQPTKATPRGYALANP